MKYALIIIAACFVFGCTEHKAAEEPSKLTQQLIEKERTDSLRTMVSALVWSAPDFTKRFQALKDNVIKKGGTGSGYMLVRSPLDVDSAYSKTYVYNLIETYIDRTVETGTTYVFDPATGKLYEQKNGKSKSLTFNTSFLPIIKRLTDKR